VWFRIFTATLVSAVSWAVGALCVWLLTQLKLPPELQAHHPFALPADDLFTQTGRLFLGALAVCGAMVGFLLPSRRYGTRKLVELEVTAQTLALLWGLLTGVIFLIALVESVSIWPFVLLSAVACGFSLMAARAVRVAKRRVVPGPWASDVVPLAAEPAPQNRGKPSLAGVLRSAAVNVRSSGDDVVPCDPGAAPADRPSS
jgi:hypothetical protein